MLSLLCPSVRAAFSLLELLLPFLPLVTCSHSVSPWQVDKRINELMEKVEGVKKLEKVLSVQSDSAFLVLRVVVLRVFLLPSSPLRSLARAHCVISATFAGPFVLAAVCPPAVRCLCSLTRVKTQQAPGITSSDVSASSVVAIWSRSRVYCAVAIQSLAGCARWS
jgi:hypothetical protein